MSLWTLIGTFHGFETEPSVSGWIYTPHLNHVVVGNYIGTDATGTVALGNKGFGIELNGEQHTIGGTTPGAGNLISGNGKGGIEGAKNTLVQGNFIGTDVDGNNALGNTGPGILAYTAMTIGGSTPGAGNVISGNTTGIEINGTNNIIRGNRVGTTAGDNAPLGNQSHGIWLHGYAMANCIGGNMPADGNTIAFNGGTGIYVAANHANTISGNTICNNTDIGIDLAPAGITANDPQDTDQGVNNLTNYPVLIAAQSYRGGLCIRGTLNSVPTSTYRLEFFAAPNLASGPAAQYLGDTNVTTDASGNASFEVAFATALPAGQFVVATATDSGGSTAEFSSPQTVTYIDQPAIMVDDVVVSEGDSGVRTCAFVARLSAATADIVTVDYATADGSATTADGDYLPAEGTLTFMPGQPLTQTISVTVNSDTNVEPDELFWLVLSNPANAFVAKCQGAGTILDDETASQCVVTSVHDDGHGSLRQAILDANANPGLDVIRFQVPGSGPSFTIHLFSALPAITDPVVIDGTTQPGFVGTPIVELEGSNAGSDADGLRISCGNSVVRGLVINRFAVDGIWLDGNGQNVIEGNYVGTDVTGTQALSNGSNGIYAEFSDGNTIGGLLPTTRNVISGNAGTGIRLVASHDNRICGNFIGVDRSGAVPLGNALGIFLRESDGNRIGGTENGARNVISGNAKSGSGSGILLYFSSGDNVIQGNYIGTDVTGTIAIGNSGYGIYIDSCNDGVNLIGGSSPGEGNLISGNGSSGIKMWNPGVVTIQGNLIGTDSTGTRAIGNRSDGIWYLGNGPGIRIGGETPGARNVISGNSGGIYLYAPLGEEASPGHLVQGNYIGPDITGTRLIGNSGCGLTVSGGSAVIVNCQISGNSNTASRGDEGGGVRCAASTVAIVNSIISCNSVAAGEWASGGGIYSNASTLSMDNCSIVGNWLSAPAILGGGVYVDYGRVAITNCILWGNSGGATEQIHLGNDSAAAITHSDIQGGYNGTGNINADPGFVRSPWAGPDGVFATADDDFGDLRLQPDSPAINAGSNAALPADSADLDGDGDKDEALPFDLAGRQRIVGGVVDIGAYEYPAVIGDMVIGQSIELDSLSIESGGNVMVAPGGEKWLRLGSLSIAEGGMLDLADNAMILDGATYADVLELVRAGKVFSSVDRPERKLAVALARDLGLTEFAGQQVSANSILVQYTWGADANFDGLVTTADFAELSKGYVAYQLNKANPEFAAKFTSGDFDGDGKVGTADFAILSKAYVQGQLEKAAGGTGMAARGKVFAEKKRIRVRVGHRRPVRR